MGEILPIGGFKLASAKTVAVGVRNTMAPLQREIKFIRGLA
jgi:hypothetical protein